MSERGYVEGQNISIFYRTTGGRDERLPDLVAELLRLKVDVLLTLGTRATRAAQRATKTVPIVMITVLDPVHAGFVASLSHPGGNITGSSELSEELVPKRLELLKEAIPKASFIAVLWDPTHPTNALDLKRTEDMARALGVRVRGIAAHDRSEVEKAFVEMQRWRQTAPLFGPCRASRASARLRRTFGADADGGRGISRTRLGTIQPGGPAVTRALQKAFEAASRLPDPAQDELAAAILEELAADERWEAALAQSQQTLERLADEALPEHRAGRTEALDLDAL